MTTETTMNITILICAVIGVLFLLFMAKPTQRTQAMAPSILTGIGIFGTFLGITIGLMHFDPNNIIESVPIFLAGIKLAFWSSVVGILASLLFKIRVAFSPVKHDRDPDETETSILTSLTEMNESLGNIENMFNEKGGIGGLLMDAREDQALVSVDQIKADQEVLSALKDLQTQMALNSQDEQNIVKAQMQRLIDEFKDDAIKGGKQSESLLEVFGQLKEQLESGDKATKEQMELLFNGLTRAASGTLSDISDLAESMISQAKFHAGNLAEELTAAQEISTKSMLSMLKEILAATEDSNHKITSELAKLRGDVAQDLKQTTEQSNALIEQLHAMTESYKASLIQTTTELKTQISKDMKASYNLMDNYTKAVADVTGSNQVESLERLEAIANIMENVVQSSSDMSSLLHENANAMNSMKEAFVGTNEGSLGRFLLDMNDDLLEKIGQFQNSMDAQGPMANLLTELNGETTKRMKSIEKAFEGSVHEIKQLPREMVRGLQKANSGLDK